MSEVLQKNEDDLSIAFALPHRLGSLLVTNEAAEVYGLSKPEEPSSIVWQKLQDEITVQFLGPNEFAKRHPHVYEGAHNPPKIPAYGYNAQPNTIIADVTLGSTKSEISSIVSEELPKDTSVAAVEEITDRLIVADFSSTTLKCIVDAIKTNSQQILFDAEAKRVNNVRAIDKYAAYGHAGSVALLGAAGCAIVYADAPNTVLVPAALYSGSLFLASSLVKRVVGKNSLPTTQSRIQVHSAIDIFATQTAQQVADDIRSVFSDGQ